MRSHKAQVFGPILAGLSVLAGLAAGDEPKEKDATTPFVVRWYSGMITLDDEYIGQGSYSVLLYIQEVLPRAFFNGYLWYQEADAVWFVVGKLGPNHEIVWFAQERLMPYARDDSPYIVINERLVPNPGERGLGMMLYCNGQGFAQMDLSMRQRKATWHLVPASNLELR